MGIFKDYVRMTSESPRDGDVLAAWQTTGQPVDPDSLALEQAMALLVHNTDTIRVLLWWAVVGLPAAGLIIAGLSLMR